MTLYNHAMIESQSPNRESCLHTIPKHSDKGGKADAVSALDLSGIDATIRESEGEKLAAMPKDILDRHEKVIYQKLPNVSEQV